MLNRRHIRIKVMQTIYAYKGEENTSQPAQEKFLIQSMNSMYDLYLIMIALLAEVHKKAFTHLTKVQNKHLATAQDKNPSKKFLNNQLLQMISQNDLFNEALSSKKLNNWTLDDEYVDVIFKALLKSDCYLKYMNSSESSFIEDKEFIVDFYKEVIAPNEKLYDYLEDKSITWIDDLPVVNTTIVKLLRKSKLNSSKSHFLPKLFKDSDDRDFGLVLLKKTFANLIEYDSVISNKTENWDKDRITNIDLVLLQMAICEIHEFTSIPVKVTINEYLEIAKEYSTPKSSVFINGILDKIIKEYTDKGTLNKSGRGLM